jgi:hypothetical protein
LIFFGRLKKMKIIVSRGYNTMTKDSQNWDPGLPPGVSERDIDREYGGVDENISKSQQGESEINVDWREFNEWYLTGGDATPEPFTSRTAPSYVNLKLTYDVDRNADMPEYGVYNIKVTGGIDLLTKSPITDSILLGSIGEYYEEKIKKDIVEADRDSGYGVESNDY